MNTVYQIDPAADAAVDESRHETAHAVDTAIRSRKAMRAFLPRPVRRSDIVEILDVARSAPSNSNLQPWQVHVLSGAPKRALSTALGAAHAAADHPPLQYLPEPMPDHYRARQQTFGARFYGVQGIDRNDRAARARASGRNFDFFGAPVGLIFTIDACMTRYNWLDYGLFMQSVMIAARSRGLDTCPQVAFAQYQALIAEHLNLPAGREVVCGMSLGYADRSAALNRLDMPREPVEHFAHFAGFDDCGA
ncbi:nitroreductase [Paraburkholderia jirisanensis]